MSNIHTNDVFDAFVAAKAAIDKVPELEAQIAKLTAALSDTETLLSLGDEERRRLRNDLDTVSNAKATVEASLDSRNKSHEDLQARFDLVVGTLRDLTGDIGAILSVVEPPEPEPVVEPSMLVIDSVEARTNAEAVSVLPDPTSSAPHNAEVGSGPTTDAEPASPVERDRKAKGLDWYDCNSKRHGPVYHHDTDPVEVTPTAPVPFAASTDAPSVPAPSTAPTSLEVPPAEQSDGALPQSPWLKWGHDNTV